MSTVCDNVLCTLSLWVVTGCLGVEILKFLFLSELLF